MWYNMHHLIELLLLIKKKKKSVSSYTYKARSCTFYNILVKYYTT